MTLKGLKMRWHWFMINRFYTGTRHFEQKAAHLRKLGHQVGTGTKIVGPIECTGKLIIGSDCWIGKNLTVNGNGTVRIGDRCDIAPEVTFQTGTHHIGTHERRADEGYTGEIEVGSGCWIGVRSTILPGVHIGDGCMIAACACVARSTEEDTLNGGVPARPIRKL